MRNSAYLDRASDVRMMYFQAQGFPMSEFERLRFGPVIQRDEVDYLRELRLLEAITVNLQLAGLSADGSRFRMRNEFFRDGDTLAARVTSSGGWLDLGARRLAPPPRALADVLSALQRSDDFSEIAARRG
jgi:acyl-CoA thioester hydrolase